MEKFFDRMFSDDAWFVLLCLVFILMFSMLITSCICCIVNAIWGYDLDEVSIECTITHMDIDDGRNYISVVGVDSDFTKTVSVTSEQYAEYSVGDNCVVIKTGKHYPIGGDEFEYSLK